MKPVKPAVQQESTSSTTAPSLAIENKALPPDSSDMPASAQKNRIAAIASNSKKITEDEAKDKLNELRSQFEDGKYWNQRETSLSNDGNEWEHITNSPCNHSVYDDVYCNRYVGAYNQVFPEYDELLQCLGFASLISDKVFGKSAPIVEVDDFDQLRIGDHIRLYENEHSMIVTEITDEYISVVEVNFDYNTCRISWGRHLSWDEVAEQDWEATYFTRYEVIDVT